MSQGDTGRAAATILFREGLSFLDAGDFNRAELRFRETLKLLPQSVPTLTNLSIALAQQGNGVEARAFAERAVALDGNSVEAHLVISNSLAAEQQFDAALSSYDRVLALDPAYAAAHVNRGGALGRLGRPAEALLSYEQALRFEPNFPEALLGRANSLFRLDRTGEALAAYDAILMAKPDLADALVGRGNALAGLKRTDEALAAFERALSLKPDLAEAWLGCGNALVELDRTDDALPAYDRALKANPDSAEAWFGRGNALAERKRWDAASAAYDRALAIAPHKPGPWAGKGTVSYNQRRYEDALASYEKAIATDPTIKYAAGARLHSKQQLCNWDNIAEESNQLTAALRNGASVAMPFELLSMPSTPADQLQCARLYVADRLTKSRPHLAQRARYSHDRIRLAYVSGDLRDHPVGYLMAGVLEQHDRAQFEVTAISTDPGGKSEFQMRLRRAFERFVDVHDKTDLAVARMLREMEIDIAVEMSGYTADCRPGILAHRAAPIQVNYLGFAGTMGADHIDYIIADRTVIPTQDFPFFSEKVVHLPDCYLPTDDKCAVAATTPSRTAAGLPQTGFVFCSFNNTYKITPELFAIWMRLLRAIDGSVLWLSEGTEAARRNLRREAERHGVAAERLIFAARTPDRADHLARERLADLFLDTLPYNAHTTACDALWVGLPVLTCPGTSFVSRAASSLLRAMEMPELIAGSLAEYESLALKIARDPALLASLKAKLARNRDTSALFDTARYTRHLESAFKTMLEMNRLQQAPTSFAVESAG